MAHTLAAWLGKAVFIASNLKNMYSVIIVTHRICLQQDLAAISERVSLIASEAKKLLMQYPDAQEHIRGKHEEMVAVWEQLLNKATQRKSQLHQAESLQMYFNDYRELVYVGGYN